MEKAVFKIFGLLLCSAILALQPALAGAKETFPKLANYYLEYFTNISASDYEALMKWDLLIIPNEVSLSRSDFLRQYRTVRPDNRVVAYVYPAMSLTLPHTLYSRIEQDNLWLRGGSGNKLEIWPGLYAVNLTNPVWQTVNLDFVGRKMREGAWDGVMYDTVDTDIRRYSSNGIDINGDGRVDDPAAVNRAWTEAMAQLFAKTRQQLGADKIIMMNGSSLDSYQPDLNGRIFEMFPTPWEGNGSWQATMYQYLRRLPGLNRAPQLYVINGSTNNIGNRNDFKKMRFGLASTLLGDGYFSFDHGDQLHEQLWWYDEYDVKLGTAESSYYNLLAPGDDYVRAGLWRRDFANGVSIVNSTDRDQVYVFNREQFEKIHGAQDRRHNDGTTVNYIKLAPQDGIIMRRTQSDIRDSLFVNGQLVRSFNQAGQQVRNSFFAYKADVAANANVILADLDGNGTTERIVERGGRLIITGPGRATTTIAPYGPAFTGKLSFAVYDFNNRGHKDIVVAPLSGGGPHVKIFNAAGRQLTPGFFAFDPGFRGGVHLAVGDVDRDGKAEIIAAPGPGLVSTVKIFSDQGRQRGSFTAYALAFRGGVNVAVGDVDHDGRNEIITGPLSGGPHVRIFDQTYRLKGQFMAFDPASRTGVRVMIGDSTGDGKAEILTGTANF